MAAVHVLIPRTLVTLAGGNKRLDVEVDAALTLGELLDVIATDNPVFVRRLRDETGSIRRYVNVYLDGADVRGLDGPSTSVEPGDTVQIIQSVAGG